MRPDNVQAAIQDLQVQGMATTHASVPVTSSRILIEYIESLERPAPDSAVECATGLHFDPGKRMIEQNAALITAYTTACVEKETAGLVEQLDHEKRRFASLAESYQRRQIQPMFFEHLAKMKAYCPPRMVSDLIKLQDYLETPDAAHV